LRQETAVSVAIITPYFKESRAQLERCAASVRTQTVPATHIVVADGHAQDWLDGAGVRHLRLDRAHGDYGNTPRAVGGILAASEGFDAIAFLDADNWLDADHVETCIAAAASDPEADFVVARRRLVRADGSVLPVSARDDGDGSHVDTNCYFLLPGSFHTLGQWGVMPKPLAIIGDRVVLHSLRTQGLRAVRADRATVNYLCTWASVFVAAGEAPPDYAKPGIDLAPLSAWWQRLDARDRTIVERLSRAEIRLAGGGPGADELRAAGRAGR
jgi:hypothetical protein